MRRFPMLALAWATGCAAPAATSVVTTTSASLPTTGLHVAPNIVALCMVEPNAAERIVLAQVARCMTRGPLESKRLALVGRVDPRVDEELGSLRLARVHDALVDLGVPSHDVVVTPRQSPDENDTRVDLILVY